MENCTVTAQYMYVAKFLNDFIKDNNRNYGTYTSSTISHSYKIKGVQRPHVVIPNGIQTIKSCNINSIKYYYIMLILSFSIVKSILFDSK